MQTVRGAIGPILTTGVALAAAGVVVANPVVAPRADVQIPAVQLSAGSGDPAGMLDQAFLDAIAPSPPESTNPFSVLRQLISSLAADATHLGKNAIVDAFVAGVAAVSQPELTASSTPYYPSVVESPELAASVLPGLDLDVVASLADLGAQTSGPVATVTDAIPPAVQTLVAGVVHDAGFVGGQIIVAAFAAGAVVAAEPGLIGDTVEALIHGDLSGALQSAVKAVAAPLGPPVIILDALRSVFEKHVGGAAAALTAAVPDPSQTADQPSTASLADAPAQPAADVNGSTTPTIAATPGRPDDGPARADRDSAAVAVSERAGAVAVDEVDEFDGPAVAPAITAAASRALVETEAAAEPDAEPVSGGGADAVADDSHSPLRAAVDTVQRHVGAALGALGTPAGAGSDSAVDSAAPRGNRARAGHAGASER